MLAATCIFQDIMAGAPKRSGRVNLADYQDERYLRKLDPIVAALQDDTDADYDRDSLGQLIAELVQFMEDNLGKEAGAPKPFPKLPAKLFRDFSPNGAIYCVAKKIHGICRSRGMQRIEFLNPALKKQNLEYLAGVKRELEQRHLLKQPVVYLHPSCGPEMPRLRDIVKKLGMVHAQTLENAPAPTHVVYPVGSNGDPNKGSGYVRVLSESQGGSVYVHHWYLPDSYDEWVNKQLVPDEKQADHEPQGPWKVYVRWLYDSEKYNEVMNPIDYEVEQGEEQAHAQRGTRGGMASTAGQNPTMAGGDDADEDELMRLENLEELEADDNEELDEGVQNNKRRRTEADGDTGGTPPAGTGGDEEAREAKRLRTGPAERRLEVVAGAEKQVQAAPAVTRQSLLEPHHAAMDGSASTENISQGQLVLPPGTIPTAANVPQVERPALPAKPSPPAAPMPAKELYMVPAHASWFHWNRIHERERRGVPDFFNGRSVSKTPKVYKEYRDFLINKYREDPSRRLTFTDARKMLAGDVNGIYRVWEFLDSWGIINFMAKDKADSGPHVEVRPRLPPGMSLVVSDLTPTPAALFAFANPTPAEAAAAATAGGTALSLGLRRDAFAGTPARPSASAAGAAAAAAAAAAALAPGGAATAPGSGRVDFYCNAMPWVKCNDVRYHCTRYPDIDLCPQAFAEGRFPPSCSAKDFIKIDTRAQQADASGWSAQETLLLLEGLELFGDSWVEVADHVGSKSALQCIVHFLQLPIEDDFLASTPTGESATPAGTRLRADALGPGDKNDATPAQEQGTDKAASASLSVDKDLGPQERSLAKVVSTDRITDEHVDEEEQMIPFADTSNPVMAQVAFLALMVGPRVAAAAAQRALEVLSEEEPSAAAEASELQRDGAMLVGAAPSATRVRAAAAAALSAAVVKAKLLADNEEREIQRLMVGAVDLQLRKVELKLRHLDEIEQALERERATLEAARLKLDRERMGLAQSDDVALALPSPPDAMTSPATRPGSSAAPQEAGATVPAGDGAGSAGIVVGAMQAPAVPLLASSTAGGPVVRPAGTPLSAQLPGSAALSQASAALAGMSAASGFAVSHANASSAMLGLPHGATPGLQLGTPYTSGAHPQQQLAAQQQRTLAGAAPYGAGTPNATVDGAIRGWEQADTSWSALPVARTAVSGASSGLGPSGIMLNNSMNTPRHI